MVNPKDYIKTWFSARGPSQTRELWSGMANRECRTYILRQGWPTNRRATQFVKDSPEGRTSVHMYRGGKGRGGAEPTRTLFLERSYAKNAAERQGSRTYWTGLCAVLTFLKPSGHYMYHQVQHSTVLRSAHAVHLWVLCGCENKQRLFPYTTLNNWSL